MGLTGPQSALPPAKNDILIYIKKEREREGLKKKGRNN
jgi:predicted component of type VI protein secretion system